MSRGAFCQGKAEQLKEEERPAVGSIVHFFLAGQMGNRLVGINQGASKLCLEPSGSHAFSRRKPFILPCVFRGAKRWIPCCTTNGFTRLIAWGFLVSAVVTKKWKLSPLCYCSIHDFRVVGCKRWMMWLFPTKDNFYKENYPSRGFTECRASQRWFD